MWRRDINELHVHGEEYGQWLSESGGGKSLAEAGADLYKQYACNTCHDIGPGPSFVGLYGTPVKLSSGQTVLDDDAYSHGRGLRIWQSDG